MNAPKVGDPVTIANVDQLPDWSITCPDGDEWNPYQKREGAWYEMCDESVVEVDMREAVETLIQPIRILRIGGGS